MGSFASVFEAFDVEKNEKIAVKHFPLESKQYFFAEAALLRSCDSPFIVTIFEIYIDAQSKHYCLAMKLCGGSIRSKVGNCPSSDLLHIANDVLSALVYLHRRQIIHRDVKPYNILLSRSGNYKLAGFEIGKDASQSLAKTFIGTPGYMSPEIYHNMYTDAVHYDESVDIFAFGQTLYALITGSCLKGVRFENMDDNDEDETDNVAFFKRMAIDKCIKNNPSLRYSAQSLLAGIKQS